VHVVQWGERARLAVAGLGIFAAGDVGAALAAPIVS
jgi:hypothetical protein